MEDQPKIYGQEPAYTGEDAAYFEQVGVRVPTVEEAARTENRMRKDSIFPPGSDIFKSILKTQLVTVVDPTHGLHPEVDPETGDGIR